MPLTPGTRLGPYQIVGPLGAGGMGEVYRATDTRLDRTVAVKVLPAHVAGDSDLRQRFEREARIISSLSHPHICTLYDVGRERAGEATGAADVTFLVMEYLEGDTLAARLARGALPIDQALTYAVQIAEALDAAHRQGVVHRDLKPGNIILTRSGAKLLDFGLARLQPAAPAGMTAMPTTPATLTQAGAIIGTFQYMAPEQLEGHEADARTDIFAFGAIVYEMVTGRKAFEGKTQASVVGAILEREPPPLVAGQPLAPPALERVVRKCLMKDPERRWQTARDLRDELQWIVGGSGATETRPVKKRPRTMWWAWTAGVVAMALIAAIVVIVARWPWGGDERRARRLNIQPVGPERFAAGGIAVSPDGTLLAYVGRRSVTAGEAPGGSTPARPGEPRGESETQIYVRRFDQFESSAVAGTVGGRAPFFSPDGQWLGFFTNTALNKVPLLGGPVVKITGSPPVSRGAVWLADDTILWAPTQSTALMRVPAAGGEPTPFSKLDVANGEGAHLWPDVLPGGDDVLFTIRRGTSSNLDQADVAIQSLRSGDRRTLINGAAYARFAASGHLLYVRGDTLMAVEFDRTARQVKGSAIPVASGVLVHPWTGGAHYTTTPDNTLVYLRGRAAQPQATLFVVERTGAGRPIIGPTSNMHDPRISPDRTRVSITSDSAEGDNDIFIFDLARRTLMRFTSDPGDDFNAIWTPDGRRIIYTSFAGGGKMPNLAWRAADGTGHAELLWPQDTAQFVGSVSPDGRELAFTLGKATTRTDVWLMSLVGARRARPFVESPYEEYGPEFSPDGRWVAYASDESGRYEVYVVPFPGPGAKRQISSDGGFAAAWSHDGKTLYYQTAGRVMSVAVNTAREFTAGVPALLFQGDFDQSSSEDMPRNYDVDRDGRLVMLRGQISEPPSWLNVVLNWTSDLREQSAGGPRSPR